VSLRGNTDQVTQASHSELQDRLAVAGIEVLETRLTHLAYAAEIAQAMLRGQEAQAVVAARRTIVAGAVGLGDMALREISAQGVVELDEEREAAMVSNLGSSRAATADRPRSSTPGRSSASGAKLHLGRSCGMGGRRVRESAGRCIRPGGARVTSETPDHPSRAPGVGLEPTT
jgi:SPFH domain / Band 7 family